MRNGIKLGVALFSYSSEYYLKKLSLKDTLVKAKEAGADGIEIVASQMVKNFPYPSKSWLHSFRRECEDLDLEPFCYSAHLDSGMRSDRWLTDDEIIMSTVNDLRSAYEMGASVVRTQHSITPDLLYRVAPYAEIYGIKVGVEIHPPHRFETEKWQNFVKVFRDLDTPYIGVIVDTGIYQEYPYDGWLNVYAHNGVAQKTIHTLLNLLEQGKSVDIANEYLEANDHNEYSKELASELFSLYRPYHPDELESLMKYVVHFHTKFYHMENGEEKTIPYKSILEIINRSSFNGYLMSEYEGHYCYDCNQFPAAEQVKAHINLEKKILDSFKED